MTVITGLDPSASQTLPSLFYINVNGPFSTQRAVCLPKPGDTHALVYCQQVTNKHHQHAKCEHANAHLTGKHEFKDSVGIIDCKRRVSCLVK